MWILVYLLETYCHAQRSAFYRAQWPKLCLIRLRQLIGFFHPFWMENGLWLLVKHLFSLQKFLYPFFLLRLHIYRSYIDTCVACENMIQYFFTLPTSSNCHLSCRVRLWIEEDGWHAESLDLLVTYPCAELCLVLQNV